MVGVQLRWFGFGWWSGFLVAKWGFHFVRVVAVEAMEEERDENLTNHN